MEQILDKEQKDFFSELLANPGQIDFSHAPQLKTLVSLYPQSGILHAMLACASQLSDVGGFQQKLKTAAVYAPDRVILYNLVNYPEKLVKPEKYHADQPELNSGEPQQDLAEAPVYNNYDTPVQNDLTPAYVEEEAPVEEAPVNYFHHPEEETPETATQAYNFQQPEEQPPVNYYQQAEEIALQPEQPYNEYQQPATNYYQNNTEEAQPLDQTQQQYQYPSPEEEQPVNYIYQPEELGHPEGFEEQYSFLEPEVQAPVYYQQPQYVTPPSEIDDEVYEEITGIEDIYIAPASSPVQYEEPAFQAPVADNFEDAPVAQYGWDTNAAATPPEPVYEQYSTYEEQATVPPQVYEDVVEPVANNDYTFSGNNFRDRMGAAVNEEQEYEADDEPIVAKPNIVVLNEKVKAESPTEGDDSRVSKYNDDQLPYSFMWWLDKTRKEHADSHQPYVPFKPVIQEAPRPAPDQGAPDELQQQYVENIFHLSSVEDLDKSTTAPRAKIVKPAKESKRKGGEIIERFIQEEPQIKPPSLNKLDNENKAKKSAEDEDELVSETLARIYTDQMLYPKAILTYQKLILKFPEKSSYFVAQIKLLEKKIN